MSNCQWKLSDENYEFIKGEVCFLFEKLDVRCIPVCGFEIAAKMGITLIAYSALSEIKRQTACNVSQDGFYVEHDGRSYIFYNDIGRSYARQNWTILHEIGHMVLDHDGHGVQEEDEANFFAKYALAPPVLVHMIHASSARDVQEHFCVSRKFAEYAYGYYLTWRRKKEREGRLSEYDLRILALAKPSNTGNGKEESIVKVV